MRPELRPWQPSCAFILAWRPEAPVEPHWTPTTPHPGLRYPAASVTVMLEGVIQDTIAGGAVVVRCKRCQESEAILVVRTEQLCRYDLHILSADGNPE